MSARSNKQTQGQEVDQQAINVQGTDAGVDDLLDEIDSVLESNAEEFVRGFVQKGGQ
ncbi:ubiquitin-like protein Pup [Glutamicibacter sp. MNS18]|uniref:ubiquitin-like protein Pup n=1 Tax=Glutamicibacter sp. MNS18 TaxID=2989817 RepID=UPI00353251BE